jgi:hypothetical protein
LNQDCIQLKSSRAIPGLGIASACGERSCARLDNRRR